MIATNRNERSNDERKRKDDDDAVDASCIARPSDDEQGVHRGASLWAGNDDDDAGANANNDPDSFSRSSSHSSPRYYFHSHSDDYYSHHSLTVLHRSSSISVRSANAMAVTSNPNDAPDYLLSTALLMPPQT